MALSQPSFLVFVGGSLDKPPKGSQKAPKSLIWFFYVFLFHFHPFLPPFSNQG
ncbi:hypothetical protein SLEP1_g16405 [Rubroshorea leprosula]|uniref:Uncharacterized protein n=1 Tax=Rubroshorea leprosula TaxID=152421 RepID=A0AAV5J181_9ROSI|nr:hypothetical protein SLEP1_g16405 [Rubroshorea leprosula]